MKFNEWICEAGITNPVPLCPLEGFVFPDKAYAGFQLAHNTVTLFYIDKNQGNIGKGLYGYDLLGTTNLTFGTSDYFMRGVIFEDEKGIKKTYVGDGMFDDGTSEITDDMKIVSSPDLRVVFEVKSNPQSGEDILTEFKVTPAYQYDILLEHRAAGITNLLATVAQKSGKSIPRSGLGGGGLSSSATMLTYDTHGTARKGFRTDERKRKEEGTGGEVDAE